MSEGRPRSYWFRTAARVAEPVLAAAAEGRLTQRLPPVPGREDRAVYAASEALCRTLTGLSPWLTLEATAGTSEDEAGVRQRLRSYAVAALDHATRPDAPDRLPFDRPGQPLVEAGFLSHAMLRTPSLFTSLDAEVRRRLVDLLRASHVTAPPANNWLLFSAMVEAFLASVGEPFDRVRIDEAVRQHERWYVGDGAYGDGPRFRYDFYNSFVIQPMLIDVLETIGRVDGRGHELMAHVMERFGRAAAVQERMIGPDGAFPPLGRSLVYRCGAFHLLAQAAWRRGLGEGLRPAAVREALGTVLRRTLDAPGTFTDDGFLQVGLAGHQPSLAERYISRGSAYLCCAVFLPLGLPASDPFWSNPSEPWTALRVWSGEDVPADHAID